MNAPGARLYLMPRPARTPVVRMTPCACCGTPLHDAPPYRRVVCVACATWKRHTLTGAVVFAFALGGVVGLILPFAWWLR